MAVLSAFYHDTRRPLVDNTFPVKLRVTYCGKQKYYHTGTNLSEQAYIQVFGKNPKGKFFEIRFGLDARMAALRTHIQSLSHFSFDRLERLIGNGPRSVEDIYPFFDEMSKMCEERGSQKTSEVYLTAKKSLQEYRPKAGFYDVTGDWLRGYQAWMLKRGKSPTTIGIYLRHLRAVMNKAIADGVMKDASEYPFKKERYKIPISRNIKKALSKDEVKQIAAFSDFHSLTEKRCRDMWLFSYLSNGINPNDICRLSWDKIDGEVIRFHRQKTVRTSVQALPITAYLREESLHIINTWGNPDARYIFDVINDSMSEKQKLAAITQFVKTINKYIRRIADRLGIEKPVTTYTARYTFSQVMKNSGQSVEYIGEALGHSSILTTRAYLDSFKDDLVKSASVNLL